MYIYFIYLLIGYFTESFLLLIMADKSSASVSVSGSGKKRKANDYSASGRKRQAISIKRGWLSSIIKYYYYFY